MNQTLTSEHVLPSAVDSPLAGWELLTGSLESASVLCIDTDDRTLTALALGCRQLRILVRDADRARQYLALALEQYKAGHFRSDPYDHPMDRVFMADIERALAEK